MRWLALTAVLFTLACQSEPVAEPQAGGPGDGPAGPPPTEGDPGPDGGGPDRDAAVRATLQGTLVHEAFAGGVLQVDVVAERDGSPQVVGMERYEQPGPFRIAVRGDFESVELIVYVDADGDGPSAGDLRVSYSGNPISLVDTEAVEGLTVDLAEAEAQDGTPKDAEGEGEGGEGAGEAAPEAADGAAEGSESAPGAAEGGEEAPSEPEPAPPEPESAGEVPAEASPAEDAAAE